MDAYLCSSIISMYGKCVCVKYSYDVFEKISQRDVILWNSMVVGYAQIVFLVDALKLFHEMESVGLQ